MFNEQLSKIPNPWNMLKTHDLRIDPGLNTGWCIASYALCDAIMGTMASQITSLTIVYSIVHSGADQRKHQSSASLAFCEGNSPVTGEFPHKWPVMHTFFHLMTSSWAVQNTPTSWHMLRTHDLRIDPGWNTEWYNASHGYSSELSCQRAIHWNNER